ncbi:MAG: hypothetical protein Q9217_001175 [Psora testacea]
MTASFPPVPATQTAILTQANRKLGIAHNVPVPHLEPDMVLVKNVAVSLNHSDYKMPDNFPSPGAIDGCDFAGTVMAVGSAVTKPLQIGDRVCGAVHGSNPVCHESGSFAQYVGATADFLWKIPDSMSFESAVTIGGAGIGTVGLALFHSLGLSASPEKPAEKPFYVLVYGGSSACGTMAIQLIRLSGLIPITTCSPKNFALVKSYGAEAAFDYNSPNCANDIRANTKNSLAYVLDTITNAQSMKLCYSAIGRAGGKYTALELYPEHCHTRKTVKPDWVMGITMIGKEIALGNGYHRAPSPEHRLFGAELFGMIQRLLDGGKLKPHPARLGQGGLGGVLEGLELLRSRAISGERLVYRII